MLLTHHDHFLVTADFDDYAATQRRVGDAVARPGGVVALERDEHGQGRLVLLRPGDPRILRRHMERDGAAGGVIAKVFCFARSGIGPQSEPSLGGRG